MKKKWIMAGVAGLLSVVAAVSIWSACMKSMQIKELQEDLIVAEKQNHEYEQECKALSVKLKEKEERILSLQESFDNQKKYAEELAMSAENMAYIEEQMLERIRLISFYGEYTELVERIPIEMSDGKIKWLYLCGNGRAELYLADYVTGNLKQLEGLNASTGSGEGSYELLTEDINEDGNQDIIFVSEDGVFLWFQKNREFLPVNDYDMGYYFYDSDESCRAVREQMKVWEKEIATGVWDAQEIATEVKEYFLADGGELLERLLHNPKADIPYTERRESYDVDVELYEKDGEWRISFPQNQYSEEKINNWLQTYYRNAKIRCNEFLGIGIKESDTVLTEQERAERGWTYRTSLVPERVDDVIISFYESLYGYGGGAHGFSNVTGYTLDARTGELLELSEIVSDMEGFYEAVVSYIETNEDEEKVSSILFERLKKDLLLGETCWYFTEEGIMLYQQSLNGGWVETYPVPYECIADYMRVEYLPTRRAVTG